MLNTSFWKESSGIIQPIARGIWGSYFSQQYLSKSERNSATEVQTELQRIRSPVLYLLHHNDTPNAIDDRCNRFNHNLYHRHPHVPQIFRFQAKFTYFSIFSRSFIFTLRSACILKSQRILSV